MKTVITDYNFYNDRADEVLFDTDKALLTEIISELKSTMTSCKYDYLAAPQIGYAKRVFCVKFKDGIRTYVNPGIVDTKGTPGFNIESSISLPDNSKYAVLRYPEVHLVYNEEDGTIHGTPTAFVGLSSTYVQQMIDILDGRLICDGSMPILDGWDKLSTEEQDEVFKYWLEQQNQLVEETKKDIDSNPELKEISDGIDFMNSVREGKTILERA